MEEVKPFDTVPKRHKLNSIFVSTFVVFWVALLNDGAFAASLEGQVSKQSNETNAGVSDSSLKTGNSENALNSGAAKSGGNIQTGRVETSGSPMLEGGIKNEATLGPSVQVIPKNSKEQTTLKDGILQPSPETPFEQYAGSVRYPVGQPAPRFPSSPRVGHPIPSIIDYTLTPTQNTIWAPGRATGALQMHKGVSSYVPGFESTSVTTSGGITNFGTPPSSNAITTGHGVTSYVPGHEIPSVSTVHGIATFGHGYPVPNLGITTRSGVTSYVPGFEISTVTAGSASSYIPGTNSVAATSSRSGITSYVPGFEISIAAPRNGIVAWEPGHEVSISTPGLTRTGLGGMWFSGEETKPLAGLQAKTKSLFPTPMFVQPVVAFDEPLRAEAKLLPQLRAPSTTSWDGWYDCMARAIYSRWQTCDVGPGIAKVRVTVTNARQLSSQVVDFQPAPYVERDVQAETKFRVSAIQAVNDISQFEIPEFPPLPARNSVTFDVMMKRTIDGPFGFDVSTKPRN